VLEDRRPADRLQIYELQRRLQVYDDAQADDSYDPAYPDYWRQSLDYDREILRRRLLAERRQRSVECATWPREIVKALLRSALRKMHKAVGLGIAVASFNSRDGCVQPTGIAKTIAAPSAWCRAIQLTYRVKAFQQRPKA
jgi:hypothetical protein